MNIQANHDVPIELRSAPSKLGRELFGENFTPPDLIDEMLDTLPLDVFTDPSLRWLDPCAGIGNFPTRITSRLMNGLAQSIPDQKTRLAHIIEKMLFMVEIQPSSASSIKRAFGPRANLANADFLALDNYLQSSFDVVVANPPYERIVNGTRSAKNDNLWSKFIEKAYSLIKPGGYLLFITPPAWMSPTSKILEPIFLRNHIVHLNIQDCARHFTVGSKFSYFLLRKTTARRTRKTTVNVKFDGGKSLRPTSFEGKVVLSDKLKFVPQLCTPLAISLLEKTCFSPRPKFPVSYDSDLHRFTKSHLLSKSRDRVHRHRIAHTPSQFFWASRPHKHQGTTKLFLPLTTYYEQMFIDECGNTQGLGYILLPDRLSAEKTQAVLMCRAFRFIAGITRWSNFNVPFVMKSLPRIDTDAISLKDITDTWVEERLGITDDESKYIAHLMKD